MEPARGTNIEVVQAGFLTYDHSGEPVDLVYFRHALHHLPDAWKAIALIRMRRMLRTGGVLRLWHVVYDFGPSAATVGEDAGVTVGADGAG